MKCMISVTATGYKAGYLVDTEAQTIKCKERHGNPPQASADGTLYCVLRVQILQDLISSTKTNMSWTLTENWVVIAGDVADITVNLSDKYDYARNYSSVITREISKHNAGELISAVVSTESSAHGSFRNNPIAWLLHQERPALLEDMFGIEDSLWLEIPNRRIDPYWKPKYDQASNGYPAYKCFGYHIPDEMPITGTADT